MKVELTKEQIKISRHNKSLAWKHFCQQEKGKRGYVLHHIDVTLRNNNIDRYIMWNIDDLVMMTKSDHTKLHNKLIGDTTSRMKEKSRDAHIGSRWYYNKDTKERKLFKKNEIINDKWIKGIPPEYVSRQIRRFKSNVWKINICK